MAPSWWARTSPGVHQQKHGRYNGKKEKDRIDNTGRYREKPKSFDESILLAHKFSRNSHDSKASSFSVFRSEVAEKKACPLPTPLYDLSSKFDQKSAESVVGSFSFSSVSCSSSSTTDNNNYGYGVGAELHDHGDFGSVRKGEETLRDSWIRISCSGWKELPFDTSPTRPVLWNGGFEPLYSPPKKQETRRHPSHPLPLPPGSSVKPSRNAASNWKKGKLLGRGTFGFVYAGFNSENGNMCAMKEVRVISDNKNSNECLKQLNQELALLSELSHPNIVQYYGSKLGSKKLSVFLEYVSGGSIYKLVSEYGPFTEPLIRHYTKQILSGLAYLHDRKTVHRDIKGSNILVDPNGDIKLSDFGMAKHITACSPVLSFKGSPYWMAPEIITNAGGSSCAVDIWSLGCTILEMATAKPPWSQYEGVAAMFKIANSKDYPAIPYFLSEDAQSFVKLCLQRDPLARPTARKLLHHPFIQNQRHTRH